MHVRHTTHACGMLGADTRPIDDECWPVTGVSVTSPVSLRACRHHINCFIRVSSRNWLNTYVTTTILTGDNAGIYMPCRCNHHHMHTSVLRFCRLQVSILALFWHASLPITHLVNSALVCCEVLWKHTSILLKQTQSVYSFNYSICSHKKKENKLFFVSILFHLSSPIAWSSQPCHHLLRHPKQDTRTSCIIILTANWY